MPVSNAFRALVLVLALLVLASCSVVNMAITPFEKVALIAQPDLNPDINGRPSPVEVKLLHLSSRQTFDHLGFYDLFYRSQLLLTEELLSEQIVTIQPGQKIKVKLPLPKGARYTVVLVAYRAIDSARWRHVGEVSDQLYYSRRYMIGSNEVMPYVISSSAAKQLIRSQHRSTHVQSQPGGAL